jgi:nucleotide-binding universal stress UspA family protein
MDTMTQNTIVITTDLSDASVDSIKRGLEHAKVSGAEVHVVHISPHFELPLALQRQLSDPESLHRMEKTYKEEELQQLSAFLEEHDFGNSVTPVIRFSEERPSEVILEYAKEVGAELIVMASQGKGALGRFLLGSNTQKVVARAPCPVLIIPPKHESASS